MTYHILSSLLSMEVLLRRVITRITSTRITTFTYTGIQEYFIYIFINFNAVLKNTELIRRKEMFKD